MNKGGNAMNEDRLLRKGLAVGIILLFMGTCIIPTTAQEIQYKSLPQSDDNPPLPPVIWTENFLDFFIQVPQNPEGDQMYCMIDWGDGTNSGWIGPYNPGETISISHIWTVEGAYQITVQAKNQIGISNPVVYLLSLSSDIKFFCVTLGYVSLTYFITIHVEGNVYYLFDWGDGNTSDWLGPYYDPVMTSYVWNFPGVYLLRWKARDINGSVTPWLSVMITILLLHSQPQFEITFNGPNIFVKNIGDANATNIHVRRYLDGGLIILGKDKTVSFSNITVGEIKEAKMGWIFGLGTTKITISVSCDEGVNESDSCYAFILFFFIRIF
jgi:hypothetical protein